MLLARMNFVPQIIVPFGILCILLRMASTVFGGITLKLRYLDRKATSPFTFTQCLVGYCFQTVHPHAVSPTFANYIAALPCCRGQSVFKGQGDEYGDNIEPVRVQLKISIW